MRRWQAAFSVLLVGCSLDSAPTPKQDSTTSESHAPMWMPEKLDAGAHDANSDASKPNEIVDGGRVDQSSSNNSDAASPSSDPSKPSQPSKPASSTPASMNMKPADPPPSAAGSHAPGDQPAGGMNAPMAGEGGPLAGASGASAGAGGASGSLSDRLIDVAWRTVANPQVEWLQRWRQAAGGSGPGLSADLVKAVLSTLLVQCARDPRQCVETCTLVESDCGACAADMECATDFKNTCGLLGAKCEAAPTKPSMPGTPNTPMSP